LRRNNINLIQYNIGTTHALHMNRYATGRSSFKSRIWHISNLYTWFLIRFTKFKS